MGLSECKIIDLPNIKNMKGGLTFVEGKKDIPFGIKRVYYAYDTPKGISRGGHAHKNSKQLIIALSGSFDVILDDGFERVTFHLNKPYCGLYVCPMIWHELNNFSSRSICLVITSEVYCKEENVENYETFKNLARLKNEK